MLYVKLLLVFVLYFCLLLQTFPLNSKNNACRVLSDYRVDLSHSCYPNINVLSDVSHMVQNYGYSVDAHSVTTSDGYILIIHRISKSNSKTQRGNIPIFLQHGINTNSGTWVDINNRSLAFILVDCGYDVWLGNVRGSTYSNKHASMTVDNTNYWDFNLDTIAAVDIDKQLKYIFSETGKKITYIGHSLGATLVFMYISAYSQQASGLIEKVLAMAPVVYLDGVMAIEFIKSAALALIDVLGLLQIKRFPYHEKFVQQFLVNFCKFQPELCIVFINVVFGRTTQFQSEDLLVFFSYFPTEVSIYLYKQFLQIADSKRFQKFDYGPSENLKRYGTREPPVYNLSSITIPVCIFYGENDRLNHPKNLERLYNELHNTQRSKYAVPSITSSVKFSHIDFVCPSQKYSYDGWIFNCLESKNCQSM